LNSCRVRRLTVLHGSVKGVKLEGKIKLIEHVERPEERKLSRRGGERIQGGNESYLNMEGLCCDERRLGEGLITVSRSESTKRSYRTHCS